MGTSAVFIERRPKGHRVTVLVDEAESVDALTASLTAAGFEVESIEVGLDTAWDVAATCPDLLIVDCHSASAIRGLRRRMAELRAHPRLRSVPVVLCAPHGRGRIGVARPQRANLRIVEAPLAGTTVRELSGQLV